MPQAVEIPSIILVAQMQGRKEEENSRYPSMKYVEPLVRNPRQQANEIVLAGKED